MYSKALKVINVAVIFCANTVCTTRIGHIDLAFLYSLAEVFRGLRHAKKLVWLVGTWGEAEFGGFFVTCTCLLVQSVVLVL